MNKRKRTETRFVRLDSRRCIACWRCIGKCPEKVIGRINLPWHKHARIKNADNCRGCLKCVNACESGALLKM
jgi:Pyruvate/2-oxoacid:ferredoxin oxidoreductase delta subunit